MNICEYLGLKPNQEFKVKDKEFRYRFNEKDEFEYYSYTIDDWTLCNNTMVLIEILHDSSLIEDVESKFDIGLSDHDTVMLNGLNKMNGSKVVKIERDIKSEDGKVRFVFENGKNLEAFYYNVKMDFLEDFYYNVFEVEYLEGGFIRVWGC